MSEIIRELTKEEQKIFKLSYVESTFYYGVFKEKQLISVLSIGKPEDNQLKYQYEILSFQGNEENFKHLWNKFLESKACHSCICKLNLNFLENFKFKNIKDFYSYYPFSVVYRIDDLNDGKFYVGMCEIEEKWSNGYNGSGGRWNNHKNAHKNHEYKRVVLQKNFKTPLDTRNFELQEIEKVFNDENNCNSQIRTQGQDYFSTKECQECGGKSGFHKKDCPNFNIKDICQECGGVYNRHKKCCSKYKVIPVCLECNGIDGKHKKTCSKYKETVCVECSCKDGKHTKDCSKVKHCPECGLTHGHHKENCSFYKNDSCAECGGKHGRHKKGCSKAAKCSECGGIGGSHKKACSKYNRKACPECGSVSGHYKTCSQYKEASKCPECGKIRGHKASCSKAKTCSECGGKCGNHLKSCSFYKVSKSCSECGGAYGQHKKSCSQYKEPKKCQYCGYSLQSRRHSKDCPLYKKPKISKKICKECGGKAGVHYKACSHYKEPEKCPECGKIRGHLKTCSKHKVKVCPECGGTYGHFDFCSKSKGKCEFCGYSLKSHHHAKNCPLYKGR